MRLTRDEILLLAGLLLALVLGVAVQHYRHQVRLAHPLPAPSPANVVKP